MTLFRSEALEAKRKRLYGVVTMHQPPSFIWLTAAVVLITVIVFSYMCTVSIARKETVQGWIRPHAGLVQVYSPKGGVVTSIDVNFGDEVKAGQYLARFSTDVANAQGSLAAQERTQITARIAELDVQISEETHGNQLEQKRLEQHSNALRAEAQNLRSQRLLTEKQLEIAQEQLIRIEPMIKNGYVSIDENDRRGQALLSQKQAAAELDRQIASKLSDATDMSQQALSIPQTMASELSKLRAAKDELIQSLAETTSQESNILRSPTAGRIVYINLSVGETTLPSSPVFAISPISAPLEAELLVPTEHAGFVAKGQSVLVMIDAYPFQRYGAVHGVVDEVSHAAVTFNQIASPIEFKGAAYSIKVKLSKNSLITYSQEHMLQSGMTLKADIITDHRTLLQWLFDPLLAAEKRSIE